MGQGGARCMYIMAWSGTTPRGKRRDFLGRSVSEGADGYGGWIAGREGECQAGCQTARAQWRRVALGAGCTWYRSACSVGRGKARLSDTTGLAQKRRVEQGLEQDNRGSQRSGRFGCVGRRTRLARVMHNRARSGNLPLPRSLAIAIHPSPPPSVPKLDQAEITDFA